MRKISYLILLSFISQGHFLQATSTHKTSTSSQDHSSANHFNNILSRIARDEKNGTITPEKAHGYRKILYSFDTIPEMLDYISKKLKNKKKKKNNFWRIFRNIIVFAHCITIPWGLNVLFTDNENYNGFDSGAFFFIAFIEMVAFISAAICALFFFIVYKGFQLLFAKKEKKRDIVQLFAEYLKKMGWNPNDKTLPSKLSNVLPTQ